MFALHFHHFYRDIAVVLIVSVAIWIFICYFHFSYLIVETEDQTGFEEGREVLVWSSISLHV